MRTTEKVTENMTLHTLKIFALNRLKSFCYDTKYNLQLTEARRQGEILAANFFEKINLCVTFYIARASIYQISEMVVWLWYSVVYNLSLYLCRYSSGATILYLIN